VKPNSKQEMHYQNDCDDKEHDAEAQSNGHRPIPIMCSATAIAPTKIATLMRNRQESDKLPPRTPTVAGADKYTEYTIAVFTAHSNTKKFNAAGDQSRQQET